MNTLSNKILKIASILDLHGMHKESDELFRIAAIPPQTNVIDSPYTDTVEVEQKEAVDNYNNSDQKSESGAVISDEQKKAIQDLFNLLTSLKRVKGSIINTPYISSIIQPPIDVARSAIAIFNENVLSTIKTESQQYYYNPVPSPYPVKKAPVVPSVPSAPANSTGNTAKKPLGSSTKTKFVKQAQTYNYSYMVGTVKTLQSLHNDITQYSETAFGKNGGVFLSSMNEAMVATNNLIGALDKAAKSLQKMDVMPMSEIRRILSSPVFQETPTVGNYAVDKVNKPLQNNNNLVVNKDVKDLIAKYHNMLTQLESDPTARFWTPAQREQYVINHAATSGQSRQFIQLLANSMQNKNITPTNLNVQR